MHRRILGSALILAVAACGAGRPGQMLVHSPPHAVGFDSLIEQVPLGPDDNIRSALLQQGEHSSVHLVRIRDREEPHLHTRYDLVVLVVRGTGTFWLNDEPLAMRAGDLTFVPKGTPHFFVNEGPETAAALVMFAPAFDGPDQAPVPTKAGHESGNR